MKPQEIKDKMSKGEWKDGKMSDAIVTHSEGNANCDHETMLYYGGELIAESIRKNNKEAIISAVNNTYGKDLNPEMYFEVVALLIEANERLKQHGHTKLPAKIETVLNAAKL